MRPRPELQEAPWSPCARSLSPPADTLPPARPLPPSGLCTLGGWMSVECQAWARPLQPARRGLRPRQRRRRPSLLLGCAAGKACSPASPASQRKVGERRCSRASAIFSHLWLAPGVLVTPPRRDPVSAWIPALPRERPPAAGSPEPPGPLVVQSAAAARASRAAVPFIVPGSL